MASEFCDAGSEGEEVCEVTLTCSGQAVQECLSFMGNEGFVSLLLSTVGCAQHVPARAVPHCHMNHHLGSHACSCHRWH